MKFYRVLIPKLAIKPLDYHSDNHNPYKIGDLVQVPFRNKILTGIVWEIIPEASNESLKKFATKEIISNQHLISKKEESLASSKSPADPTINFNIGLKVIDLIKSASRYYLSELGAVAKLVLPVDIYEKPIKYFNQDLSFYLNDEISSESTIVSNDKIIWNNRLLLKLASDRKVVGDLGAQGQSVLDVHEDMSTKSTHQSPAEVEFPKKSNKIIQNLKKLNTPQSHAFSRIIESDKPILLHGVTGSGKTEIYFHVIAEFLKQGKQCLIMLPEIGILNQIAKRFEESFNFAPVIWNSSITKAQKKPILRGIISGGVKLVIGTRSSLFLPYQNLGAIIVDEEHDPSYKQSDSIRYNARDMAVLKAHIEGAKIILASATPSMESIQNAREAKYELIKIPSRFNEISLPEVKVIDMRKESLPKNKWISKSLLKSIKQTLEIGAQSMIFLNRRGYAPLTICKSCGYRFECKNCSSYVILHKSDNNMQCHHCGAIYRILTECPECSSNDIIFSGPGIERIQEELTQAFPKANISVLSRKESSNTDELNSTLTDMAEGKIDILIGTQIITKGYHFPKLAIVGVIDADMGLSGSDFRASERSFQLLHQVGGRAGREDHKGVVYLQSYNPDNRIIKALAANQEDDFIKYELESRQNFSMPPFGKMAVIYFSGKNEDTVRDLILEFARLRPESSAKILGPIPANLYKFSGSYRYQLLIISGKNFNIQKYIDTWFAKMKIPSNIKTAVDIDPQQFL